MPPASYMEAANAVYQPQQQAEAASLKATHDETINSDESEKGQVSTDYQDAIDKLTQSVQDQTASIKHDYSEALGGNFTGLIGNDLGQLFSRANEQQSIIGQTRANKLAEITAGETNADIDYNTNLNNLTPKYQSLEAAASESAYAADQKSAQEQANSDRTYNLDVFKANTAATNSANSTAANLASKFTVTGKTGASTTNSLGQTVAGTKSSQNGYQFTGPNGQPINLAEYAAGAGKNVNDVLDLLQNGSSYDQAIYRQVKAAGLQNSDPQAIINLIAQEDTKNYYGFK